MFGASRAKTSPAGGTRTSGRLRACPGGTANGPNEYGRCWPRLASPWPVALVPGVDLDASTKVGLWGHSEGSATSRWAAQLAAAYAPEPNVVGTSGAPPARNGPRPSRRSSATSMNSWRSTTSRPSAGSICARQNRSSRPSTR
ncbi:lipase family protein [Streptomyces sp. NPDC086796]|uniref:lipase family protein n=1 Tax=unclassified Streptomyces TaxID=2593676 RepID=UPI00381832FF